MSRIRRSWWGFGPRICGWPVRLAIWPSRGETVVLHADPGALYLFDGAGALVQQVERAAERAQRRPQVVPVPPDMPVTEAAPTIFALR